MKITEAISELGRPVAYYPKLARVFGIGESIFISQFIYWNGKQADQDDWIYKTAIEIEDETGLTPYQQRNVRNKLKTLGVLEEREERLQHKMYYRILEDCVDVIYNESTLISRSEETAVREVKFVQPVYTENTTETTTSTKVEGMATPSKPRVKDDVFSTSYGNRNINEVITTLSKQTLTGKLDGTDADNRRRAHNLLQKYDLETILQAIDRIEGSFYEGKITSVRSLGNHLNELLAAKKKGGGTII